MRPSSISISFVPNLSIGIKYLMEVVFFQNIFLIEKCINWPELTQFKHTMIEEGRDSGRSFNAEAYLEPSRTLMFD